MEKTYYVQDLMENAPSVEDVFREVSRIKTVVSEAVEDGVKSAVKGDRGKGRHTAEDVLDDAGAQGQAEAIRGDGYRICCRSSNPAPV